MSRVALQRAYAALQRGDIVSARRYLAGQTSAQAVHLSALVEKKAGDVAAASRLFARAAVLDPSNPEVAHNHGLNARAMGDHIAAIKAFQRALALRPELTGARKSLSRSLIALRRWAEAETEARAVLEALPDDRNALYTLASARLERGDAETADAILTKLIDTGRGAGPIHFVRGRARLEMDDLDGGLTDLRHAHKIAPDTYSLRALAGVYWMTQDKHAFRDVIDTAPAKLSVVAIDLARQSGDLEDALSRWSRLPDELKASADGLRVKSNIHQDQGLAEEALASAQAAFQRAPGDPLTMDLLATAQLMAGCPDAALETVRPMRLAQPDWQNWIALEATALRQLGDPAYGDLVRMDAHVQAYDLPVPDGFTDIEHFNEQFIAAVDRHRRYSFHPLDQSLRDGAQTARSLTAIREPAIEAYIRALDTPIKAYMRQIGRDPVHPLSARNTGNYEIAGCWSVRLHSGGRHVNHIHPEGWISSAYYASVPPETVSGSGCAGWVKFGEPPFRCDPSLGPERWVQPRAGMLVLFPSFLWHGTEPIRDGSTRVTAPFDVVPV